MCGATRRTADVAAPERSSATSRRFREGKMARETGLEPATSGVTGRRSNQLSYSPAGERAG